MTPAGLPAAGAVKGRSFPDLEKWKIPASYDCDVHHCDLRFASDMWRIGPSGGACTEPSAESAFSRFLVDFCSSTVVDRIQILSWDVQAFVYSPWRGLITIKSLCTEPAAVTILGGSFTGSGSSSMKYCLNPCVFLLAPDRRDNRRFPSAVLMIVVSILFTPS